MIRVVNPIEYKNWNDLILTMPNHSFFHTSEWSQVLWKSYRYEPFYFVDFEGEDVQSILPVMGVNSPITGKRGVSLPFSDYCEPLINNANLFQPLLDHIIDFGRKEGWKYLELRGGSNYLNNEPASESFCGHVIDLTCGTEKLFNRLKASLRRDIRRAERDGIIIEITTSTDSIKRFFYLNCLTRREHGLPPQPYSFFKNFHKTILSSNKGFVATATYKSRIISASVFLLSGKNVIYKYNASDKLFGHLNSNKFAMWTSIDWCCKNGYDNIYLGRTDIGHDGLRRFKNGWNAKEYNISYHKYSFTNHVFKQAETKIPHHLNGIIQRLPISVLQVIGSLLYRHVG